MCLLLLLFSVILYYFNLQSPQWIIIFNQNQNVKIDFKNLQKQIIQAAIAFPIEHVKPLFVSVQ